jgi:hypothetical protein
MSAPDTTTIKVSRKTRDRLMAQARQHNSTAEQYLRLLLTEHEWQERMDQAKRDMAQPDQAYSDLIATWDITSADGLD